MPPIRPVFKSVLVPLAFAALAGSAAPAFAASCDHACLEKIGDEYRAAYIKHDPSLAPFAKNVKFSENNVALDLPDGSWDTVSEELGPALTFSDPQTGGVGIYTAVMQKKVPGYLTIRLKVVNGKITEAEHILVTQLNLGHNGQPFGDPTKLVHDPDISRVLGPSERISRDKIIEVANGYFNTLEHNDGTLKTKFGPNCQRSENGKSTADPKNAMSGVDGPEAGNCWYGFKLGRYAFNNRVRDRDYVVVDRDKGLVLARGYIDHKGVLGEIHLTNGKTVPSMQEPQSWSFLELFKVENGDELGPVESDFIQVPYYTKPVWPNSHPRPDPTPDIPDYKRK